MRRRRGESSVDNRQPTVGVSGIASGERKKRGKETHRGTVRYSTSVVQDDETQPRPDPGFYQNEATIWVAARQMHAELA